MQLGIIDDLAVPVENLRHQDGHVVLAVIYHRAVAVDQLEQIDIAAAQTERLGLMQG